MSFTFGLCCSHLPYHSEFTPLNALFYVTYAQKTICIEMEGKVVKLQIVRHNSLLSVTVYICIHLHDVLSFLGPNFDFLSSGTLPDKSGFAPLQEAITVVHTESFLFMMSPTKNPSTR